MNSTKRILFIFILGIHSVLYAQEKVAVYGKVTDAATGFSLPGVKVSASISLQFATSSSDGNFRLALKPGPAVLLLQHPDYEVHRQELDLNECAELYLNFTLDKDLITLSEIVTTVDSKKNNMVLPPVSDQTSDYILSNTEKFLQLQQILQLIIPAIYFNACFL